MNHDARPADVPGGREYQLGPELGRGSFGSVYRGRLLTSAGFQKDVAIKVLSSDRADEQTVRRLRDEARLLGLLKHRAIVGVDDLVQIDGKWAVVMEYVEGVDLARLTQLGPLPLAVCCEIGREVALALETAHSATHPDTGAPLNVVHRDIKTTNVRLTAQADVKVLDFGIARAAFEQREAHTQKAQKFGTPGYMAPERFMGHAEPASDVFALGALLYRALSGVRMPALPPVPSGFESGRRVAFARLPASAAPLVPLLEKMMAFDLEARPSAAECATALRKIAARAEGPYLEEWAAEVVGRLQAEGVPPVFSPEPIQNTSVEATMRAEPTTSRMGEQPVLVLVVVVLLLIGGVLLILEGILLLIILLSQMLL